MASRAAEMLVESDDDRPARQDNRAPTNLTASTVEFTPAQGAEPEFEIVDADENLQPLRPEQQQQSDAAPAQGAEQREDAEQQERDDQSHPWHKRPKSEQHNRRRQARDRTFAELHNLRSTVADLEQKLATYEPRFSQIDQGRVEAQVADVDRQITEQRDRATAARRRISEAVISQDGDALAAALDDRDQAIIQGQQLAVRKNVLTSGNPLGRENLDARPAAQRQEAPRQEMRQPAPLPREAQQLARDFADEHDWIDMQTRMPDGRLRDPDSRLLAMIDADVLADGYNPAESDYWEELATRGRDVLPHRFGAAQRQQTQQRAPQTQRQQVQPERRGPMTGGSSDRGPARSPNQVYLNPSRKMALIQAGALEPDGSTIADKVKFKRLMQSYSDYDRANGAARQ